MKVKIVTVAEVPVEFADAWMQHLRDFDTAHAGCHFRVVAESDGAVAEAMKMLDVKPEIPLTGFMRKQ